MEGRVLIGHLGPIYWQVNIGLYMIQLYALHNLPISHHSFALWIPIHYSCFTEQSLLPPLRSLTHEWRLTHFPWFLRVAVCFWSWVNSYSNRLHIGICMIVSACDGDVLCFTGVYTHFRYRVDKSMRNLKIIKFMHLRTTILVVWLILPLPNRTSEMM